MSQIKVNSIVPVGGLPSGSSGGIIQCKQAFKGNTFTTTSSTFTDVTGLSVSITPSSNSSQILVRVHICGQGRNNYARCVPRLMRDSTPIGNSTDAGSRTSGFAQLYDGQDGSNVRSGGIEILDSPATTSSVTYKVQIRNANETGDVMCINRTYDDANQANNHRYSSSITVMEVST